MKKVYNFKAWAKNIHTSFNLIYHKRILFIDLCLVEIYSEDFLKDIVSELDKIYLGLNFKCVTNYFYSKI